MRYRIRSHASQPLELHLAARTVILGPHDLVEVEEDLEANGQVAALRNRGLLAVERLRTVETPEPVPEQGKTSRARKPRSKRT
jgi:hypothetical protein